MKKTLSRMCVSVCVCASLEEKEKENDEHLPGGKGKKTNGPSSSLPFSDVKRTPPIKE